MPATSKPTEASTVSLRIEHLPFLVRLVSDREDLSKAIDTRYQAYARHLPDFAQTLIEPEALDDEEGVVVLLAESKLDGSALGTMRIQTNQYRPLLLEQSIDLPDWLRGKSVAEATRLGITDRRGSSLIKAVLFKAFYHYCLDKDIHSMVIAARSPMDRQYMALLFEEVYPEKGFIELRHANNIPHRVLSLNVANAETLWSQNNHPLLDFMCNVNHPDLHVPAAGTDGSFYPPLGEQIEPKSGYVM